MEPHIMVTGKMIYNMVKVSSFGTTIPNMKVNIQKDKNMDTEVIHGKMAHNIQEPGKITEFMDKVDTYGTMDECMRVIGKTTTWMATVNTIGKMVESTSEHILKIRNTDTEYTLGQMEGSMMENGSMEDNMDKESIFRKQDSIERAIGKMVREKSG